MGSGGSFVLKLSFFVEVIFFKFLGDKVFCYYFYFGGF